MDFALSTVVGDCEDCCTDPPSACPGVTINFDDGTFGTLVNDGTTPPWSVIDGRLTIANSSYAQLNWTKDVEDFDVVTRYEVEADLYGDTSTKGQGVQLKIDQGTAILRISDDNKLVLEFIPTGSEGGQPFTRQEQLGSIVGHLFLTVYSDLRCGGRSYAAGIAASGDQIVALSLQLPIDVSVTVFPETFQGGVLAYPKTGGSGVDDPCCVGFDRHDAYWINQTFVTDMGNYTVTGLLSWSEVSGRWEGTLIWNACGEQYNEFNYIVCNGTTYSLNNFITASSVNCNAGTLQFGPVALPLLCMHEGDVPQGILEFLGQGTGAAEQSQFDNVRVSGCAGLPSTECPRASCGDWGQLPLKLAVVVPDTLAWKTPEEGGNNDCGPYPVDYLEQFTGSFHLLLQPHIQADPDEISGIGPYRTWYCHTAEGDAYPTICHVFLRDWVVDNYPEGDIINPGGYRYSQFGNFLMGPCAYAAGRPTDQEDRYEYAAHKHWRYNLGAEACEYSVPTGTAWYVPYSTIGAVFSKRITYEEELINGGTQVIYHPRDTWRITFILGLPSFRAVYYIWEETKDPEIDPNPPTIGSHTLVPDPEVYPDGVDSDIVTGIPSSITITTV